MSTGNQKNWSPEQLEEWVKPALGYLELIRIARTARSNTEAKNLALEFTTERGLEEKVAMACRWLRILRVKDSERFKKLVFQIEQNPKKEEKEMKQSRGGRGKGKTADRGGIKVHLPEGTKIKLEHTFEGEESWPCTQCGEKHVHYSHGGGATVEFSAEEDVIPVVERLLEKLLKIDLSYDECPNHPRSKNAILRSWFIKILEKRFGAKVMDKSGAKQ